MVDIAVPDATPVKPLTLKIRLGNEVVTADTSDIASVDNDSINPADMSSNSIRSSDLKQNNEEWGGMKQYGMIWQILIFSHIIMLQIHTWG